jgi:ribosomal protein S12 methylthiotransferase accessory factor
LFYQALNAILDITLSDELELADYTANMTRMYGTETMNAAVGSVSGKVTFHGLTRTSIKLEGLDKHLALIESYKKLHEARTSSRSS